MVDKYLIHKCPELDNLRLVVIAGNSDSGKSSLLKYFIQENINNKKRTYKKVILLCSTHSLQETYDFLPDAWKYDDEIELGDFVDKLFEIQKAKAINGKIPDSERIMVVLDDQLGNINPNAKPLMKIASRARHFQLHFVLISQTIGFLASRTLRSNSTYLLYSKMSDENLELVLKKLQSYMSRDEALDYIERVWSEPYRFIVVNVSTKDTGPPIYTYKLDYKKLRPNYRIVLKEKDLEEDEAENEMLRETDHNEKIIELMNK